MLWPSMWPGAPGTSGLAVEFHRRLRAARQRVDLADDGDRRMAGAPLCPQIGRHAGAAELDREAGRPRACPSAAWCSRIPACRARRNRRSNRRSGRSARRCARQPAGKLLLLVGGRLAGQRRKEAEQRHNNAILPIMDDFSDVPGILPARRECSRLSPLPQERRNCGRDRPSSRARGGNGRADGPVTVPRLLSCGQCGRRRATDFDR